jgi:tape measure domain-containing protein
MSNSVDKRIVQMEFDNKQFENGIKTSTKSLDNLKKGLQLDESAKSLSNLDRVGKSFSLAGIASGVDTIANKFSTLGIIGVTAIANITNSAINAGKQMIKSLTIDPIKMGFDEYETKMGSIQTILTNTASKGTTLKDVTAVLDDLNKYSDQTIYNFEEMTRNIGTFTAAGIDLKTSATAIKGIANLAAGSGSNAQQASTAMYQLSQALAAGKVSLMDWNSVVNAGMGGELFKKNLLDTAKSMKLVKTEFKDGQEMVVTYTKKGGKELKTFRESLESGWLTSKVLTSTLEKFASDKTLLQAATQVKTFTQLIDTMKESVQSGWAQTWETIIGDKDEAAKLFTSINDVFGTMIGKSSDARNAMLSFWKANGGRDMLIEGITNAFKGLQAILKPISEAFRDVFPAMTGQRLLDITKGFRDLTAHFKIGAETASNIKITFKGLFSVLDIGVKGFKLLTHGLGLFIKALIPGTGSLLSFTASIGEFLIHLNESIDKSNLMNKALDKMKSAFIIVKDIIEKGINAITPILKKLGDALLSFFGGTKVYAAGLDDTTESFSNAENRASKLKLALDKVHDVFSKIGSVISNVAKAIKSTLSPIFDSIKKKFDEFSIQDIGSLLTGGGLLMFAKTISKGLSSVDEILGNFAKVIGEVGDTLKAFQLKIKAGALLNVAIALGILAAAIIALSFIKMEDLAKSLGALTITFGELVGALFILNKTTKSIKMTKIAGQLIGMGIAILLLSESVKILSSIDPVKAVQGTVALAAIMGMIGLFINLTKGGDLAASAGGLVAFSIGITILTGALVILGKIDTKKLEQGGIAIASLMSVIALFVKVTKGGDLAASAGGLTGFAIGITILAGALSILGKMKYDQLMQGGMAIMTLITVIGTFVNLTNGSDLAKSAGGLMGFAIGITILTGALSILGHMKPEKLIQGGIAIGTIMAVIANFINLTNGADLKKSAGGLVGFAIGITILTGSLAILASLKTASLIQGTIALQSLIGVIGLFIDTTREGDLAKSASGLIGFSIGLIAMSTAVAILASINSNKITQGVMAVVTLMTAIAAFITLTKEGDLEKSAKGLIGFSTGLMILAGVIAVLSALNTEKLIMASVAISLLIASIATFVNLTKEGDLKKSAVGLIAFSLGIGVLATSLIAIGKLDTDKIIASGAAISVLLLSIIAFIKLTKGSDLIVSAAGLVVFSGALMVLSKVITSLGSSDIKTLLVGIGSLAGSLIILGLTSAILAPLTPVILSLSAAIVLFGIGCVAVGVGMMAFAEGLNSLSKSGAAGAEALTIVIASIIGLIPLALKTLAIGIIDFAKTIGDGAPVIAIAFMKVFGAIIDTVTIMTPKLIDSGMKLIAGILKGIADNIGKVIEAGVNIIVNFLIGISNKIPAIIDTAFKVIISFINGLANAIRNNHNAIYDACSNLISAIVEAITDLMPKIVDVGKNIIKGFTKGFSSMGSTLVNAAKGVVGDAVEGVKKFLGIHSPSRVFAEIGKYSVLGFAGGLDKFGSLASDSANNVGNTAMNSLSNAMSKIYDSVNGNIDMNPTIRPVLDLSNVTSGIGTINSIFSNTKGMSIDGSTIKASYISRGMDKNTNNIQNKSAISQTSKDISSKETRPLSLQLVLQNGRVISEYLIDDLDKIAGSKNKIDGRMVGI